MAELLALGTSHRSMFGMTATKCSEERRAEIQAKWREAGTATRFKSSHGMSMLPDGTRDSTYTVWRTMRQRCHYKAHKSYPNYGGAGISVCARWDNFSNFLEDMGRRPLGMTLDRWPNGAGNYEPNNCRWATPKQQARNRKTSSYVEAFGKRKLLVEWCEEFCIREDTFRWRLKRWGCPEMALTEPVAPHRARSVEASN